MKSLKIQNPVKFILKLKNFFSLVRYSAISKV